ncbi:MAG: sigma-54-dependent Fis family transcriptional regulator [Planctomycetes bacterium]|nr:sigma-54-dependent Fis family transcriptional regulator [Planctomycetota bacterium]
MAEDTRQRTVILVVDDDGDIRTALEMLLAYEGYEVWTARSGEEALARLERERGAGREAGVVLTDVKMPGIDGVELLGAIRERPEPPPVVMISGHADVATAVDAMQRGAANFLEKPLEENRVLVTIRAALRERQLIAENAGLRRQLGGRWELIGESPAMQRLRDQVAHVAASEAAVLITGENGSGKEVVARNLHLAGPRRGGPFVTVNCAAIPDELIESELFGHEKGSFTGAVDRRIGHFEAAHGGTLFLDEIGDMPLAAQAKVLRALETHEVMRVGDSKTIGVDIRVIAATNADLAAAVEEKTFRLDLFYRLNVVPLRVPPLRERREDVPRLAEHFLVQLADRTGRRPRSLSAAALERLAKFDFPGNVRQLRNLIEGADVFADGPEIGIEELEQILANGPAISAPSGANVANCEEPFHAETFEQFKDSSEALFFRRKLDENEGNVKRTAERLGMQRSHLYKKLDRYDLRG